MFFTEQWAFENLGYFIQCYVVLWIHNIDSICKYWWNKWHSIRQNDSFNGLLNCKIEYFLVKSLVVVYSYEYSAFFPHPSIFLAFFKMEALRLRHFFWKDSAAHWHKCRIPWILLVLWSVLANTENWVWNTEVDKTLHT